jgi:hypothetical protein
VGTKQVLDPASTPRTPGYAALKLCSAPTGDRYPTEECSLLPL